MLSPLDQIFAANALSHDASWATYDRAFAMALKEWRH